MQMWTIRPTCTTYFADNFALLYRATGLTARKHVHINGISTIAMINCNKVTFSFILFTKIRGA